MSPRPMPRTKRPPAASCTVAATVARAAGSRVATLLTPVANCSRSVALGREGGGDEGVADQVLRVGEGDAVPSGGLRPAGGGLRRARLGDAHGPELHGWTLAQVTRSGSRNGPIGRS